MCSQDPSDNCVHAPTPDITPLPAPGFTATYNAENPSRQITFVAAILPPHHPCPGGGVPYADIPCSFRGLSVSARVYVPGAKAAALITGASPTSSAPCDFTCPVTMSWAPPCAGRPRSS